MFDVRRSPPAALCAALRAGVLDVFRCLRPSQSLVFRRVNSYAFRMSISARFLIVSVAALTSVSQLFAAGGTIRGVVKNADGKTISGANVTVKGRGGAADAKTVKTDEKGNYAATGYGDGTYNVILTVNGVRKAFIANVGVREGEVSTLNFELQGSAKARPYTKGKHYVLAEPETGSNLQRGIEVDDHPKQGPAAQERVARGGSDMIRHIQENAGTAGRP